MLRSLFSGVSGMQVNQTRMDVVANNIANVNTTAFKAGYVHFKDLLSQTIISAAGSSTTTGERGGINPSQVGLGVTVAGIGTQFTQGALQNTGRPWDLAINGNSFFEVMMGNEPLYTRDGTFHIDEEGYLVTADGYKVQSTTNKDIQITGIEQYASFGVESDGQIVGIKKDGSVDRNVDWVIKLVLFDNPQGLSRMGNNMYKETANSGDKYESGTDAGDYGVVQQYMVEMSNVELAREFTEMIITSRAYQANSKSIKTSAEMLEELLSLKR